MSSPEVNLLSPEDPDYELEYFWCTYKCSLENFYKTHKLYQRPINKWSDTLNILKGYKYYDKIQKKIFEYLTLHMVDVIKSMDLYHSQILKTNFNRYLKMCKYVEFCNFTADIKRLDIIFRIYYSIINKKEKLSENERNIFRQVELLIFYDNFDSLFIYAVENNKYGIIDKLKKIIDLKVYFKNLYNKDVNTNMKGIKILQNMN